MNDLSGLQWQDTSNKNSTTSNTRAPAAGLPLQPTPPVSRGATPQSGSLSVNLPGNSSASKSSARIPSPANDSFASLLSSKPAKSPNHLSLQERQKQLQEEKARQQADQQKQYQSQFGINNIDVWENLGSGKGTPSGQTVNNGPEGEEDVLSAFSAAAPVDSSSYFPPPKSTTPAADGNSVARDGGVKYNGSTGTNAEDDDDPFGLGAMSTKPITSDRAPQASAEADDDVLGLLGKPVSEFELDRRKKEEERVSSTSGAAAPSNNPQDKALAELVDMGFSPGKSRRALAESSSGVDVQAAVGILLNRAHDEARQKTRTASPNDTSPRRRSGSQGARQPTWMRAEGSRSSSTQRRQNNGSPANDKDVSQYASDIGSSLFKQANTLWKTGQKRVQRAVADLQQDSDPNQPKWMREAKVQAETIPEPSRIAGTPERSSRGQAKAPVAAKDVTDEALLLETDRVRPQKPTRSQPAPRPAAESPRGPSPAQVLPERTRLPARTASPLQASQPVQDPRSRLTKQAIEEQSSQAYVSPARRKKPTKPTPDLAQIRSESYQPVGFEKPTSATEEPLRSAPLQSRNPYLHPQTKPAPASKPSTPVPVRPKPAPRTIPNVSPSALSTSHSHRQAGSSAFKRGDYASAHSSYSSALTPLPQSHPLTIILLSNRSLTSLKTGDPKSALADADTALSLIGPARGEGETIALGAGEGDKEMREFWGKAVMRKAEALENLEKWTDAATAWKTAVEAGVGGAVSARGRDRCEKAAAPKPVVQSRPAAQGMRKPAVVPAKKVSSALDELGGRPPAASASEAEAVRKLREQNAAAERVDDEKFALTDAVDAKLAAWRDGKADNLRALLGSLDTVLWADAGWKKVGMQDLIMPTKVKVVYMKAIAKVHPDKIPQNANTEQRMISAAVFSTLNEAWDKFKKDNGL
ncbi:MAG: hypothetical protein M1820_001588 [Bogoriella megaspora]|nr:MAG: hypothetical protein M1820_001588 [Bogoriella megaspora]